MKEARLHLNLLKDSEKLSSSPVRLRVMMPVLALFAFLGMIVWWGMIAMQILLVKGETKSLQEEYDAKKAANAEILKQMGELRNLEKELEQFEYMKAGRRTYGELLACVADVVPARLQMTSISVPEAPPQVLPPMPKQPPPRPGSGAAAPALPPPAPKETFEPVTLRIKGLAPKETHVIEFMEALESPEFAGMITVDRDPRSRVPSPRVHAFRQADSSRRDGSRMLLFDIEYVCPERRFEKQ